MVAFFETFLRLFETCLRLFPDSRGGCDRKSSMTIENFNPGSKFSISIENFNLDQKFQSRGVSIYGALLLSPRRARSKISIHDRSLEMFNPEGRDQNFLILGPSGLPPGPEDHFQTFSGFWAWRARETPVNALRIF